MDITKHNHLLALADFAKEVERCDFCAIDQEMTGVDIPGTTPPMGASPDAVYYAKRIAVEAYNAFQMGIALFTKVDGDAYEVRPYNFYLLNTSGDLRLGLSAIYFLANNSMNFQTWLTSGLVFCNEQEEHAFEAKRVVNFTGEAEEAAAKEFGTAADECLLADGDPLVKEISCSTDLARRLKAFIEQRSENRIAVVYEGKPYLAQKIKFTLRKLSEEESAAEKVRKQLQHQRERANALGFRQFWNVLVKSKKPIVGHNFMQDIMFMHHMHQQPLPQDYALFKQQLHNYLPEIYDTKTIAGRLENDFAVPVTHLGAVYQECRRRARLSFDTFSRKFRLPPGFYGYNDEAVKTQNKAHEAAYDAYMTGVAFCIMRELYADVTAASKNVISAYGSVYYMCIDAPDRLVSKNTFVLETAVPCSTEEMESLFYATEDKIPVAPNSDKIDLRKLTYWVSGLQESDNPKLYNSFCVRMKVDVTAEQLHERIQTLRDKTLSPEENVNISLLPHIVIRNMA